MKIGFCGNTNNYPFRLARALRALGHEVLFFVDRPRSEPRHRPECHYTDVPYPYPGWIQEIEPLKPISLVVKPTRAYKQVLQSLEACDGVVLNGLALSLGTFLHSPTIGLLTGSDLDVYANLDTVCNLAATKGRFDAIPGVTLLKRILFGQLVRQQRAGIADCCLLEYAIPGLLPHADALLEDIGVKNQKRACFMLTEIESLPPRQNHKCNVFRIFCATRLQWKKPASGANVSPLDTKGTDIMLEGLQKFIAGTNRSVRIDLIRFGIDVAEVEHMVNELGLRTNVHWHAELTQTEFLNEMAQADVVLENFGVDGGIGMAGRDAIAMGIPVIAWGKSQVFEHVLGESLPIYEARTPDEICSRLKEIVDGPPEVENYSMRARAFAERWFSTRRAAEHCAATFEQEQNGGAIG